VRGRDLAGFYPGLALNQTLRSLDLSGNSLTLTEGALPVKLLVLSHVRVLNLANADLELVDFIGFSETLPLARHLWSLNITYNGMDLHGAMALAAGMERNGGVGAIDILPILIPRTPMTQPEEAEMLRLFAVIAERCERNVRRAAGRPPAAAPGPEEGEGPSGPSVAEGEAALLLAGAQELATFLEAQLDRARPPSSRDPKDAALLLVGLPLLLACIPIS
jgi:hypothetical protein